MKLAERLYGNIYEPHELRGQRELRLFVLRTNLLSTLLIRTERSKT